MSSAPLRFAVIAHRRTGSNHLVKLLGSHPGLACLGEIFRNQYNVARFLPDLAESHGAHAARLADPGGFLRAVGAGMPEGTRGWGFKLMPFHLGDAFEGVVRDALDRVVVLRRDNLLAQHSSELIAKETGQGVAGRQAEIRTAQVEFAPRAFERFRAMMAAHHAEVDRVLGAHGTPRCDVEYRALAREGTMERLCAFLGVEAAPLSSDLKKRNPSDVLARFTNPDTARAYLRENGLEDWAVEDLG